MNNKSREFNAHLIIHIVAVAAAAFSFAFSWAPGVGPTLGDGAVLTILTISMTMMIGALFDKEITDSSAWSVGSVAIGYALGTSLLKGLLSFFPGVGPIANAGITLSLHEAIGWGLYTIFNNGGDPTTMSSEALKESFEHGREIAKQHEKKSKEMDRIRESMAADDRDLIKSLEKKIASKDVSLEERETCVNMVAQIYRKYGYKESMS